MRAQGTDGGGSQEPTLALVSSTFEYPQRRDIIFTYINYSEIGNWLIEYLLGYKDESEYEYEDEYEYEHEYECEDEDETGSPARARSIVE
ncbi:hypothetical protein TWF191_008975 [Orbilia oligospora]|uniref:Uncharacterized protein n=1 Tax=Orbilia oligospora TaxID=2813651 RepID=A0A7C8USN3_ORBOL|nr:hypothetical protein TWF191_008975 [Orbilia oligospora]KAF3223608.1 hypothetical protein TWF679_000053 [Orbilia oligospora]